MSRISWDEYFMRIAHVVSERSTCDRAHVGAVLVSDNQILATGYNGSPAGLPHCDNAGHLMDSGHCVRTIHAEINAIIQCAKHGINTNESVCYVTHFPCLGCTKALINSGIKKLVVGVLYNPDPIATAMMAEAKIEVFYIPIDTKKGIVL